MPLAVVAVVFSQGCETMQKMGCNTARELCETNCRSDDGDYATRRACIDRCAEQHRCG